MITRNRETQLLANQDDKRYKLGELFNRHYMTKMEEACNQFPVIDEDCILEHDGRRYIPLHHANELMKELLQKEATCNEGAKSAMIVVLGFHFQDYPSNQVTPVPFQAQQPPQDVVDYMTMIITKIIWAFLSENLCFVVVGGCIASKIMFRVVGGSWTL